MKNQKQFETYLYSTIGVVVMGIIVLAINVIARPVIVRSDLTHDKIYTLSDGTKRILSKLDTPVQVRLYLSESEVSTPVELKTYASRVDDMLNEFKLHAHGNLEIKKLDPVPNTEAEDSANLDGVEGQMLTSLGGDRIYFGLAVSCLDARTTIPFLSPERERLLEYDLIRAISQVAKPTKPVIGVMSGLPVFGEMNPMMMQMGRGGSEPWVFVNELKADYEVKEVPMTADRIDDDIQTLMVIYPKGITEDTEYALDQFVLRGGKLIAFLDPLSVLDSRQSRQNPMQGAMDSGATLEHLLKAWGVSFDTAKVVSDKQYYTELGGGDRKTQVNPAFLQLPPDAMDTNDVATSEMVKIYLPFAGAFSGSPAEGLKETVLMRSSPSADLTEKMLAQYGGSQDFTPSGKRYSLAVRLSGKFKTAFPGGKPAEKKDETEKKDEEGKNDTPKTDAAKAGDSLKESKTENSVVLIGDADMLHEQFYAQVQNFFGMPVLRPFSQNLAFVQNLIEQMSGDQDLITIRSRSSMNRPFTKMLQMEADANARFAPKIKELEQSISELNQKRSDLLRANQPGQQVILSAEARAEKQEVEKKFAEVNEALRQAQRNLKKDIDSLKTTLQWTNILLMPALVAIAGVGLGLLKRQKTASR